MPTDDQPRAPGHAEKRYGTSTRRVNVWLREPTAIAVARIARAEGLSVSAVLRRAVEAHVGAGDQGAES